MALTLKYVVRVITLDPQIITLCFEYSLGAQPDPQEWADKHYRHLGVVGIVRRLDEAVYDLLSGGDDELLNSDQRKRLSWLAGTLVSYRYKGGSLAGTQWDSKISNATTVRCEFMPSSHEAQCLKIVALGDVNPYEFFAIDFTDGEWRELHTMLEAGLECEVAEW